MILKSKQETLLPKTNAVDIFRKRLDILLRQSYIQKLSLSFVFTVVSYNQIMFYKTLMLRRIKAIFSEQFCGLLTWQSQFLKHGMFILSVYWLNKILSDSFTKLICKASPWNTLYFFQRLNWILEWSVSVCKSSSKCIPAKIFFWTLSGV